jgi:hypothetical protein
VTTRVRASTVKTALSRLHRNDSKLLESRERVHSDAPLLLLREASLKKILIIVSVVLVLALGVAGYFAYKRWGVPLYGGPNRAMIAAEESLATQDVLLLASFDMEYLRALDLKLNGTPRLPDLVAPNTDPDEEPSTLDQMRRSILSDYADLKYVSMAVFLTKEHGPSIMIVFGGTLRQDKALSFLKNNPNAKPAPNLPNAWIVQGIDSKTCKPEKEWTIVLDDNRIIALDAPDAGLIERVRSHSPAERDLTRWREFRKGRFASLALFLPESLPDEGIDPMARSIAENARKKLSDFDAFYLGASAIAFPPTAEISAWISTKSAALAEQKAADWKKTLAASRRNWENTLPTLAALHDRALIAARENIVLGEVKIDKELGGQLRNLAGEFIELLFSGFNAKQITGGQQDRPGQEVVDKAPATFKETVTPDDIKPYDPKATFADEADVTSGPFGISLSAVRMSATEPRAIELEISAKGTGLPNLFDGQDDEVDLRVTSVKDRSGGELLRPEHCGPDRNGRPAKGRKVNGFPMAEVQKTVRLIETAGVQDIARIEGVIRTHLPSRVEAVVLKAPKSGDHFDRDNTRVEVLRVGANEISYRVSGDTSKLLLVRGKNAKGEILSNGGRSSTKFPGGPISAQDAFQGSAAEVEFLVARAIDEETFPFALANAFPQAAARTMRNKPVSFSRYTRNELKRDLAKPVGVNRYMQPKGSAKAGPAVVDLDQLYAFFNMGMNLSVYLPLMKNMEQALTAVELEIDSMQLADGSVVRPEKEKPWRAFVPMGRSGGDAYLKGTASIELAVKGVRPENVRSVNGHIMLRAAERPKLSAVDATRLGKSTPTPCGPVMVTEISRSRVRLEGKGRQECVYGTRALAGGRDLAVYNTALRQTGAGWELDLDMNGLPDKVELVTASKRHTSRYPFTLHRGAASGAPAQARD